MVKIFYTTGQVAELDGVMYKSKSDYTKSCSNCSFRRDDKCNLVTDCGSGNFIIVEHKPSEDSSVLSRLEQLQLELKEIIEELKG